MKEIQRAYNNGMLPIYLEEMQFDGVIALLRFLQTLSLKAADYSYFTVGYIEDYVERVAI